MSTATKCNLFTILLTIICFSGFMGCGSSGDEASTAQTINLSSLKVLPEAHDFGIVTIGNSVSPLEVTIRNDGSEDLSVSGIALSDSTNFVLDLSGGTNPCQAEEVTLSADESCTMTVDFDPQSVDNHAASLTLQPDDTDTKTSVAITGSSENISRIDLTINQIDACPRNVTAYVTITDQGGYPVKTLNAEAFSLTEDDSSKEPIVAFVDDSVPISIVVVMDYSGSITYEPDSVSDMENAAIAFVNQLGANDEAAIIKYATIIEETQAFTSDRASLIEAIQSTTDLGDHTSLYDAVARAVSIISERDKARRAVIIITDGKDDDGMGNPISVNSLEDIISDAKGSSVPVFTVGIRNADASILQEISDATGGIYFDSPTSDNLTTIHQQLADLLFNDQYLITYTSDLSSTESGLLTVTASYAPDITGEDTIVVPECP